MEREGGEPSKVPSVKRRAPTTGSRGGNEQQQSASKVRYDADGVFKVPLAPPPKRKKIEQSADVVPAASASVAPLPAEEEEDSDTLSVAENKTPPVNLLADIQQARAVAEWENSYRRKHEHFLTEAKNTLLSLNTYDIQRGEVMADKIVEEIIANRRVGGAYGYFCIESLIAAVEIRDNPSLKEHPVGVYCKRNLCSINALANDQGVQPGMPIELAMNLCKTLRVIQANYSKYNQVTTDIKGIVKQYDQDAVVSMNHAEVNLTRYFQKSKQPIEMLAKSRGGEECIVDEIRRKISEKTGLKVFAGVGPTPLIAKLASLLCRPNGVYVVPSSKQDVDSFLQGLPVTQFCGVPGKIESMLRELDIETSNQIWDKRGSLPYLVNEKTMLQLLCICLGCTPDFVRLGLINEGDGSDSVTHSKWMYGTRSLRFIREVCQDVCLKIEEKMKLAQVVGKLIVVRVYTPRKDHRKKFCTLVTDTNRTYILMPTALRLLDLFLTEDPKLLISGIRIDVSELSYSPDEEADEMEEEDDTSSPSPDEPGPSSRGTSGSDASDDGSAAKKGDESKTESASKSKPKKDTKSKKRSVLRCPNPNCSRKISSKRPEKAEKKMAAHVNRCLRRMFDEMLVD